ncbi:type II toxin-antitoxin system CcdA family antitoxin [Sinimarinibacterium sp. NLF-5-8]|uniref:type II toxin-antitoxin system CcdA family antitoxin n=1 Tax=Sinimarinibacterium sp. NLF-5-8 TaxID=2698684 RepID=UPI00137C1526|nr:type II toxin-antitoxin system CcdA family antitoxin [Sinimarinibacterium sp. NLF-5-8]QHS10620.1 type II toxin-antitoxin system CcdA family antitoxin [Sinimarinibacterium sp. NLF-5-8]
MSDAPCKQRLNVTVRADLIEAARKAKLNLSQLLEDSLLQRLRESRAKQWQEEHRDALAAYRARVAHSGPWNKDLVRF